MARRFARLFGTSPSMSGNELFQKFREWFYENQKLATLAATNVVGLSVGLLGYFRGTQQISLLEQQMTMAHGQLQIAQHQRLNESKLLAVQFLRDFDTKMDSSTSGDSFKALHTRLSQMTSPFESKDVERQRIYSYITFLGHEKMFVESQTMVPDRALIRAYADYVNVAASHPFVMDALLLDETGAYADFAELTKLIVDMQEKAGVAHVRMQEAQALVANFERMMKHCRDAPPAKGTGTLRCPASIEALARFKALAKPATDANASIANADIRS